MNGEQWARVLEDVVLDDLRKLPLAERSQRPRGGVSDKTDAENGLAAEPVLDDTPA
jgi:hypothetical protein